MLTVVNDFGYKVASSQGWKMCKEWLRNKWSWFQSCFVRDPNVSFSASAYPLVRLSRTLWGPLGYKFFFLLLGKCFIQPPRPSLNTKGHIQIVTIQEREGMQKP